MKTGDNLRPHKMETETVVAVRNAYKRYNPRSVVLAGLDMTIERGTIYGLLGPSGCGKSTLLSCIVGRLSVDSGSVDVLFRRRKDIGYMPQDIALNFELTIGELLTFYGRIYVMSWASIAKKTAELMELLELPPRDRLVGDCSGGQQRRISMAVTLIHDPELLILDEPTVGIDPLLCASIWECFFELVQKRKKTIVITTHYIEEAKSANRIGLMRNGILLAENTPQMLMEKFDCDSLEDVFLSLSKGQASDPEPVFKEYPPKQKQPPLFTDHDIFNPVRYMAQLKKNWSWTKQNLGVTLFVMVIPTLCLSIVCTANITNVITSPVGVIIPEDHECPSSATPIRPCLKITDFTCRYIELLEKKYPLTRFSEAEKAYYEAKKGRLIAILYFHSNFTPGLMERIEEQSSTSLKALDEGTMYASFDMSSFPLAHRMVQRVYESLEELLYEICDQCSIDKKLARIPIGVPEAVHGSRKWRFQDSFLPSTVLPFLFYTTYIYSSSAIAMELSNGLVERYQTAGLTLPEILLAQVSLQLTVLNIQNLLLIIVVYGVMTGIMIGSFGTVWLILFLTEVFGMSFGILVALIVQKETAVSMIGVLLQLGVFMYCGCVWPIEGQHWVIQTLGASFPVTPLSKSYFNVALRGWSITKPEVYTGTVLITIGTVVVTVFTAVCVKLKIIKI